MKKNGRRKRRMNDRDTMRPEYDFSHAVRGATSARYAQGANVVVIDPDVLDVFPTGVSVNEALRALAPVLRQKRRALVRQRAKEPRESLASVKDRLRRQGKLSG